MEIMSNFDLDVPPDDAYARLLGLDRVASCVSGLERFGLDRCPKIEPGA